MNEQTVFKDFLHDFSIDLIERTKDESLYSPNNDFNNGYRMALYAILHRLEGQAEAFCLNPSEIGLDGFSSDAWLREGLSYWKKRE